MTSVTSNNVGISSSKQLVGSNGIVNKYRSGGFNGLIMAATPRATPTLNRLEPSAFPIAISGSPARAAMADENISGADVPNATIVRPITKGDIPRLRAKAEAPNTSQRAPKINPMNPRKIMTVSQSVSEGILNKSVCFR